MQDNFFIRTDGKYVRINFDEIIYLEGCGNYIKLFTETKTYIFLFSIKKLERILPSYLFRRIHRSFIVSLDKLLAFDSEIVYLKDKELPIGHQYRNELRKTIVVLNQATDSLHPVPLIVVADQRIRLFETG